MTELAKKLGVFINEFFCLTAKKQVSIMLLEESRPYRNGSCASVLGCHRQGCSVYIFSFCGALCPLW